MSKYTTMENKILRAVRVHHGWTDQRTLARKIVQGNVSISLRKRVTASGLKNRSFASVYSALRRLDIKISAERRLASV